MNSDRSLESTNKVSKIQIKSENIRRLLPSLLSQPSFTNIFGRKRGGTPTSDNNTKETITITSVRLDPRQTHIMILWSSPVLEELFEFMFRKSRGSEGERREVNRLINHVTAKISQKLNKREGKARAFIARNIQFRRVPRVQFQCSFKSKSITVDEFRLGGDELKKEQEGEISLKHLDGIFYPTNNNTTT